MSSDHDADHIEWLDAIDAGLLNLEPELPADGLLEDPDPTPLPITNGNGHAHGSIAMGTAPEHPTAGADDEPGPPAVPDDLFRLYTPSELMSADLTFRWLIKGLLSDPTYGQIAGEMKTLKSYLLMFIVLGLSHGVPIFDTFTVPAPVRVVMYVGEGGRIPFTRRLRRVADAMGIDRVDDDMLAVSFDVAPVASLRFQESLERDLATGVGLLAVDPLYSFHGTESNAGNLHEAASVLNAMSGPCADAGTNLLVANHFNQTGTSNGLKRITQAGSGEWVDSWVLTSHREPPDVGAGNFKLNLEIGSREWGGTVWDIDLAIGRFDPETGSHDGEITWDLRPGDATAVHDDKLDHLGTEIVRLLRDRPIELTRAGVLEIIGGHRRNAEAAFDRLADAKAIVVRHAKRAEGDREVARDLWEAAIYPVADET